MFPLISRNVLVNIGHLYYISNDILEETHEIVADTSEFKELTLNKCLQAFDHVNTDRQMISNTLY